MVYRIVAVAAVLSAMCLADEPASAPPRAAQSVHLSYVLPDSAKAGVTAFYNEVTVEKSVLGSYFQVCGFAGGYFGIQERGDKKVGIFSVWDTGKPTDDKHAVEQQHRVTTAFVGDGVRVDRFGGEGTGGHSDFDCDWAVGKTYRFYVAATVVERSTQYDAWFKDADAAEWKHVATFAAPDGGRAMKGLYAFIEDFRRDGKSVNETRRATYSNGWVKTATGEWLPLRQARFTASGATWEDKTHIDAGVVGDHFYLQTGGDTAMSRELKSIIALPDAAK